MKIGIIGSGIAGLATAYRLVNRGHRVTLFEKRDSIGMATHAVTIAQGNSHFCGDVPSRMFNEAQWPSLLELYREIGVECQAVVPTQSFSNLSGETYLKLKIAGRPTLNVGHMLKSKPRKILADAARLMKQGNLDLEAGVPPHLSFRDYLNTQSYSNEFVDEFLYPTLCSTVCTCSFYALDHYPARIVLEVLRNLSGAGSEISLLRTRFGTSDVVRRLIDRGIELSLKTEIVRARTENDGVLVEFQTGDTALFDHVVVATQANHAERFLPDLDSRVRQMLRCFQYETIPVVVHTDPALMPENRKDWSTFNMVGGPATESDSAENRSAMCTVWMNRFHDEWKVDEDVFQTIGPTVDPNPDRAIQSSVLQRPVVRQSSYEGWDLLKLINSEPNRRVWFCGSYAEYGVPLLESGVVSSQRVVQAIDKRAVLERSKI